MVVADPLKGPPSALMTFSDNFKFNRNNVNRYLYKIIFYLPLADSSTLHYHVPTFFALSGGKVKSTLTFKLVVILQTFQCHCIRASSSGTIFY